MGNQMEKRPPSGKWYILSIAMFLGAIGISIYGIANFWEHLDTKEQKLPLPASGCIKIDTPGVYNVGFEYHDDYADFDLSRLKITIKKNGQQC